MTEIEESDVPLPEKTEGGQKEFVEKIEASSTDEAKQIFETAKKRLLDVNNWDKICGAASAVFKLTDERGNEIEGTPKIGDHFKIDVPGPGSKTGEGWDWVRVEEVDEESDLAGDKQFLLVRVRPSDNPQVKEDDVAHFFSDKATSNFIVIRDGNTVSAAVVGRNEVPNTGATHSIIDKIRNAFVGTGAVAGLSHPQWNSLVKGVMGK